MNFRPRPFKSIGYKSTISNSKLIVSNLPHTYLIYADEHGLLTRSVLETGRILISRALKKKRSPEKGNSLAAKVKGISYHYVTCTFPITKKGTKSRMGKGKGAIDHYVSIVNKFQPIYCIRNIAPYVFIKLYENLQVKFPVKLKYYKMGK
jgi:ribosomal protein L16/L10AE